MHRALLRIYKFFVRRYWALLRMCGAFLRMYLHCYCHHVSWMYRARLRMYRALLRMYGALLRMCGALLQMYGALLLMHTALLLMYTALLRINLYCSLDVYHHPLLLSPLPLAETQKLFSLSQFVCVWVCWRKGVRFLHLNHLQR